MALIYKITGENKKAVDIYKQLLRKHHQSYLYSELAALASQPSNKIPLLCKAIQTQKEEKFRTKLYIQLAELLVDSTPQIATYLLSESIRIRQAGGFHVSQQQLLLSKKLADIQPATSAQAIDFIVQQTELVKKIIG